MPAAQPLSRSAAQLLTLSVLMLAALRPSISQNASAGEVFEFVVKWKELSQGPSARHSHAMAAYDGLLYVHGGLGNTTEDNIDDTSATQHGVVLNDLHVYNPDSDSWQDLTTSESPRLYGQGMVAIGGSLYVYSGNYISDSGSIVESSILHTYNISAGTWANGTNDTDGTDFHDFRGAYNGFTEFEGNAYLHRNGGGGTFKYDVALGNWTLLNTIDYSRKTHGWRALNGNIYLHGGAQASPDVGYDELLALNATAAEQGASGAGAWTTLASSLRPMRAHAMVGLSDLDGGSLVVHGGMSNGVLLNETSLYHISNNSWHNVTTGTTARPPPRQLHQMERIGDRFFLFGGKDSDAGAVLADFYQGQVFEINGSVICEKGEENKTDNLGRTICHLCPIGYYKDVVGNVNCTECPFAHITQSRGATNFSDCFEDPNFDWAAHFGATNPNTPDSLTCCVERELGCNETSFGAYANCSEEVNFLDVRIHGPRSFVVGWSIPNRQVCTSSGCNWELDTAITGYKLILYDTALGFDASGPPYSTPEKSTPLGNYNSNFDRAVAPCKVWYASLSTNTGLYENGYVSKIHLDDSGFGVGKGTMKNIDVETLAFNAESIGWNFTGTFDVCKTADTRDPYLESNYTGFSFELCQLNITNPGRYFLQGGSAEVSYSTRPNQTAIAPPRISYSIEKELTSDSCDSLWCRPAYVIDDTTASNFIAADGSVFAGLQKGHEYALAVVSETADGFGKFPAFDANLLGTYHPGGWVKRIAMDLPAAPRNLNLTSCHYGRITVTWDLPEDLGTMTYNARNEAETTIGKLAPLSVIESVGGEGEIKFKLGVATSDSFGDVVNHTLTLSQAKSTVARTTGMASVGDFLHFFHDLSESQTYWIRVAAITQAGEGAFVSASIQTDETHYPSAPPISATVIDNMEVQIHLSWWLPYGTNSPEPLEADDSEPILAYRVNFQGMLLYEGVPQPGQTCGVMTDPGQACCVKWRPKDTSCGRIWVCKQQQIIVSGMTLGILVEHGGSYNFTIEAKNEKGWGNASFVHILAGNSLDKWDRHASHCTTSVLTECAQQKADAICNSSGISLSWCNSHPGMEAAFGLSEPADVNECETGAHNCHQHASCANTFGSFECPCNVGYHDIGEYMCADNNECLGADLCGAPNATCSNTDGSFLCVCAEGFYGENGQNCLTCGVNSHSMENRTACTCNSGYSGDPCVDENECLASNSCAVGSSECQNTEGSYVCVCKAGYFGDGTSCTQCTANSNSSQGSLLEADCQCLMGYEHLFNPCQGNVCLDRNECTTNFHNCSAEQTCTNTAGSYTCV